MKANLNAREAERAETGESVTPSLSWSKFSFINEFNALKNGKLDDSPQSEDGTRGLA